MLSGAAESSTRRKKRPRAFVTQSAATEPAGTECQAVLSSTAAPAWLEGIRLAYEGSDGCARCEGSHAGLWLPWLSFRVFIVSRVSAWPDSIARTAKRQQREEGIFLDGIQVHHQCAFTQQWARTWLMLPTFHLRAVRRGGPAVFCRSLGLVRPKGWRTLHRSWQWERKGNAHRCGSVSFRVCDRRRDYAPPARGRLASASAVQAGRLAAVHRGGFCVRRRAQAPMDEC